jgi:hypothetical protein
MRETVDIRAVFKLGYMLETPRIPHYSISKEVSDNVSGAVNQQERLDFVVQNPQRPYARH